MGFAVVARPTGDGDFETFRAGILAEAKPELTESGLAWRGRTAGPMSRTPAAGSAFTGPFLTSPTPGVIRMTDGKTTRVLDFNEMTVREDR